MYILVVEKCILLQSFIIVFIFLNKYSLKGNVSLLFLCIDIGGSVLLRYMSVSFTHLTLPAEKIVGN